MPLKRSPAFIRHTADEGSCQLGHCQDRRASRCHRPQSRQAKRCAGETRKCPRSSSWLCSASHQPPCFGRDTEADSQATRLLPRRRSSLVARGPPRQPKLFTIGRFDQSGRIAHHADQNPVPRLHDDGRIDRAGRNAGESSRISVRGTLNKARREFCLIESTSLTTD